MALLGHDGLGFELASRLQSQGIWRSWLGEKYYSLLQPHLATSSSWAAFMQSSSASHNSLQLRVRALLYDKASVSLFLDSSTPLSPSLLDSSYLQLHADNVYMSLDQDAEDWSRIQAEGSGVLSSLQIKFGADLLPNDVSADDSEESVVGTSDSRQKTFNKTSKPPNMLLSKLTQGTKLKRSYSGLHSARSETSSALPAFSESISIGVQGACDDVEENDLWYKKLFEKGMMDRMHRLAWRLYQQKLSFKDRESCQRTPQSMAGYLAFVKKLHKRRRIFRLDQKQFSAQSTQIWETGIRENSKQTAVQGSSGDGSSILSGEDFNLLPEVMFPWNCLPDNPVSWRERCQFDHNSVRLGTSGMFRQVSGHNYVAEDLAVKDLGLRSELMPVQSGQFETSCHPFSKSSTVGLRKQISDDQASHLLQQVIVDIASSTGFHGLKQVAMDSLSRLFTCHIQKLGSTLRLLVDRYQSQCSQIDLLKMFIHNSGCGDFGELLNVVKSHQQMQLHDHQMHMPAQVHSDLEQSLQQMKWHGGQLQAKRKQQISSSRSGCNVNTSRKSDKERTVIDVKSEMTAEPFIPADPKPVFPNVPLITQQQLSSWQQQQLMQATALHHPYAMQQMKQLTSLPLPSLPQQALLRDSVPMKVPHLKVEGLQELITTDASIKQELEDDKEGMIGSPSRRQ